MMDEINLFIIDISSMANTSGVNRYITTLLKDIKNYSFIHICQIQFIQNAPILFHKEEITEHYINVTIPYPQQSNEIISERYWFQKYSEQVFSIIQHLFENKINCIIHIHTLNLIALALYIKNQIPCKIITHLHCIPWKNLYNKDKRKFNRLYFLSYLTKKPIANKMPFFTNNCEWESYTASDRIICVTDSGKNFLQKTMKISGENITVIPNGINDWGSDNHLKNSKRPFDTFQCLFVGVLTESKGIFYILKALRQVQLRGYKVILNMAGKYNPSIQKQLAEEYGDLQINLLGRISFEELLQYYKESDIGIIASLQEQCSYVAIEMAMFGLPIITTAVDGLDEMFTDGVNALKVNILFSKVFGLRVDTDMMADKIITLIENDELRRQLGKNARELYKERFNLEQMMQQTVDVYKQLVFVPSSSKKSVLFCIDTLNGGGAEKVLLKILEDMNPDQFSIDLLVIHNYGVYFDSIPSFVNYYTLKEAGAYLSKNFDIEIAFQEGFSTKYIAGRKTNAKKIAWVHCDLLNMHWTTSFYKNDEEEEKCYAQMNQIVFVSDQSHQNFKQLFPNLQCSQQVIHNPIDRESIVVASKAMQVAKNKLTLCSLGRIVECKGYFRLIPILSQLIKEGFDFEYWILGEGNQRQKLEGLIKQYELENVVILKGFHENPYPYLRIADVFVLASFTESYSLSLCEALCLGKPILATQVSGVDEILDKEVCGWVVSQDEESIYEGLKRLIEDKRLRESLENKALIRSKVLFDYRKTMEQVYDLFKKKINL
jgi:glycosyltransferase involved in cell wall biosynthesis